MLRTTFASLMSIACAARIVPVIGQQVDDDHSVLRCRVLEPGATTAAREGAQRLVINR